MANSNGWGDGSVNNNIGWGQGANNTIGWGKSQLDSWSGATDIDGGNLPSNSVAPAITGTAQEGQTLSCSTGTWSGSPSYTYQWKRNGNNIGGATSSTYLLVLADVGQNILCAVTATNFVGSATANSNTVVPTSSVDADAQAFITAASITDPTQQSAINQLVIDLKGYNIWTKMKALYPMVGGTAAQHKWNLKDPRDLDAAFRLVFNGGWTHSVNGATPNGTNAYADTFLTPSITLTTSSAHFSKYNRTNDLIGNKIDGVTRFDGTSFFQQNYSAGNSIIGEIGSLISYTQTDTRGLFTATRTATNVTKVFKNSTQQGVTNTTTITNIPISNIYIGARNSGNNVGEFYNSYQCAFASIGDGLSDTEAANYYTAVQTFQTTLGRSIGTQTVSDADAQAFVTNAGIVDQVEANAVNNLVIGLKADSLWTKMKAVYPFVGGTSTTNSYNLKNTAQYQITWNGGATFSSNGVQFNNVNSYGNTGLIPSSALTLNSTHMSFYSRTFTGGNDGIDDFGAYNGVNQAMRVIIKDANTSNHILDMNSASQRITGTVADCRGFFLANRETSTALRSLRNNVSLGSNTNTNTGTLPSVAMYLGGLNNAGSFANPSGRQCAFASVGDGLTTTDQTNLNTRVTTFQTALNRNV